MEEWAIQEEFKKRFKGVDDDTLSDLWEEAREKGVVEEVTTYGMQIGDLFEHSKQVLKWWRKRDGRTPATNSFSKKRPVRTVLDDSENERKAALEEYLATYAAGNSDVYMFRKRIFNGRILSTQQALEFLNSGAARILRPAQFEAWSIPYIGHHSTLIDARREITVRGKKHLATVTVDPPGMSKEVQMVTWAGTNKTDEQRIIVLEYPDQEGRIRSVEAWSVSLLGELKILGDVLSKSYRWQPAQAVWFVLTGEIPAVPALRVFRDFNSSMNHRDTTITIEASPWVSPKAVERAFRRAQIKTLGSQRRKPLGKKNLQLVRFVLERSDAIGLLEKGKYPANAPKHLLELELVANGYYMKMPKGKDLVDAWNDEHPYWSYKSSRQLWRDYNRTLKSVAIGPPYEW